MRMNSRLWFVFALLYIGCTFGQTPYNSLNGEGTGLLGVLDNDRIMKITFERNPGIASAAHKLESATYNFRLFEREYSQFIPFKMESKVTGAGNHVSDTVTGDVSVGMEKEFFNGSSIVMDAGSGVVNNLGRSDQSEFVQAAVEFPLFSSNRKLSRIIKRTYEENELYDAQLSYVEEIRQVVLRSLEMYYDLISRVQSLDAVRRHKAILDSLLLKPYVQDRTMDRQQIQDEINTIQASIDTWLIEVSALKLELQTQMDLEQLDRFEIKTIPLNFDSTMFYGREYIANGYEAVLQKALANDNAIKIMQKTMNAATEKKMLTDRGKWDILFGGALRYDHLGAPMDNGPEHNTSVSSGIELRRYDRKMLDLTRLKAEADINSISAQIKSRENQVAAQIKRGKTEAESNLNLFRARSRNAASRWLTFQAKLDNYLNGNEIVDNLLQSLRSHLNTETDRFWAYNEYLDSIRDLDHLCGVYFTKLGIEVK
jgi:hypothetical protein